MDVIILVILVSLSAMFSGLTIGLSSLSKEDLIRMKLVGEEDKALKASRVLNVVEDYNLLLVTLLLGNTVTNALITNFLGSVVGTGIIAVTLSTFLILIFGEITPGAFVTKHALTVGSFVSPFVKIILILFYPISKPISHILTKLIGSNLPTIYSKNELKYIIDKHQYNEESEIDEQDGKIIKGVLSLADTIVGNVMTKRRQVYSIEYKTIINQDVLNEIKEFSHTRIPVTKDNRVIGIINVKELIGFDINQENILAVDLMKSNKFLVFDTTDELDSVLNSMIKSKIHLGVVFNKDIWSGIITMEDVLEKMLQQEIYDETDDESDMKN